MEFFKRYGEADLQQMAAAPRAADHLYILKTIALFEGQSARDESPRRSDSSRKDTPLSEESQDRRAVEVPVHIEIIELQIECRPIPWVDVQTGCSRLHDLSVRVEFGQSIQKRLPESFKEIRGIRSDQDRIVGARIADTDVGLAPGGVQLDARPRNILEPDRDSRQETVVLAEVS